MRSALWAASGLRPVLAAGPSQGGLACDPSARQACPKQIVLDRRTCRPRAGRATCLLGAPPSPPQELWLRVSTGWLAPLGRALTARPPRATFSSGGLASLLTARCPVCLTRQPRAQGLAGFGHARRAQILAWGVSTSTNKLGGGAPREMPPQGRLPSLSLGVSSIQRAGAGAAVLHLTSCLCHRGLLLSRSRTRGEV